ncbi:hypothetical protein [Streptomyces sp. NPDC059649]|uniref:hypothetical protein n=1 Tax=Streptomyces sp. NPDC059649 TaxID=3346895 RepID=UPI0036B122E6
MFLVRRSAEELQALHRRGALVAELRAAEQRQARKPASDGEARAWALSLPALARDLIEAGLGGVEMMVEYELPGVETAADVVLAGVHPRKREPSYVVTELKQWRRVTSAADKEGRFHVENLSGKPKKHPAEQTAVFCRELLRTRHVVTGPDRLTGLAYLHNAAEHDVADLLTYRRTRLSHIFTRDSRGALIALLRAQLGPEPGRVAADRFVAGELSVQLDGLQDGGVPGWHEFRVLSDVRAAEQFLLNAVRAACAADKKRVLLVSGMTEADRKRLVSGVARQLADAGYATQVRTGEALTEPVACDVMFCEAARWRSPAGRDHVFEGVDGSSAMVAAAIRSSRVPVFVVDSDDTSLFDIRRGESLTHKTAEAMRIPVQHIELDKEFR